MIKYTKSPEERTMNQKDLDRLQKVSDHLEAQGEENIIVLCGCDEVIANAATDHELRDAACEDTESVGNAWFDDLRVAMNQAGIANISYDIKTAFSYWNGGPGRGRAYIREHNQLGALADALDKTLTECVAQADAEVNEWLKRQAREIRADEQTD